MTKVSMSTPLGVSAEDVWKLIGGFQTLHEWHPAVKGSNAAEGGRIRELDLGGGAKIVEKLERFDDKERVYSYSILSGPLPVANYLSTLTVRQDGKGSRVEWSSEFTPKGTESDAVKAIEGVYTAGFDNLRKMVGG